MGLEQKIGCIYSDQVKARISRLLVFPAQKVNTADHKIFETKDGKTNTRSQVICNQNNIQQKNR